MKIQTVPEGIEIVGESFLAFFGNSNSNLEALSQRYSNLRFTRIRQTHSDIVLDYRGIVRNPNTSSLIEGDAHITNEPNEALCINTADCIPVLIFGKKQNSICAIHAGWRGVENQIIKKSIHQFLKYEDDEKEVVAFIGPHIRKKSFEIETKIAEKILSASGVEHIRNSQYIDSTSEMKCHLDLTQLCKFQLGKLGLTMDRVIDLEVDTFKDLSFHSFRRDKEKSGRQISFITKS